ncbi:MAG: T9SS type A sorting domain-containing protein [Bacteroidota bacterium]
MKTKGIITENSEMIRTSKKTDMKRFIKIAQLLVIIMVMVVNSFAQTPTYSCVATADTLTTSKIYQFDVYIYRTGTTLFYLNNFQLGFKISNTAGILNGGTVSGTYVAGSSALPSAFTPGGVSVFNIGGSLLVRVNGCPSSSNGTLIPTTGLKIGTFRLTNTNDYDQMNPNTIWWDTSPATTYIYAIIPPAPTGTSVEISTMNTHTTSFTDPILNGPVIAYNVTGSGTYCSTASGLAVGLSNSQLGVLYRLIKNGTPVGSWIPGTGSALAFGTQTFGTYTVTAYRKATYITNTMTGSAVVNQSTVLPTIAGNATVCAGSTGNVYTTEALMTGYVWVVSAGGIITAGGLPTSNFVTVTWSTAGAKTVSVNYTNSFGCTAAAPTVYNVTVNALPAPAITGTATACSGSAGNVYTTQTGMTGYNWIVTGGTVTAGAGTSAITVTWNTVGAQTVSLNYTNASGCQAATPTIYNVTVNPLPTPTLTGPATVCAGTAGSVYTTQAGMTGYAWIVSAGGTVTGGGTATSNTITVTWTTAGPKTVSVNYANAFGCTAPVPVVYNITVNPVPVPTITGPASICANAGYATYVTEAGNTGYAWSVSAGGTINTGQGTNTIQVTWGTAGPQTVTVNYSLVSGCSAATPTLLNVTVNPLPGAAGAITGTSTVCAGATGVSYSVAPVTNALSYAWTLPAGATVTAGQYTNNITVAYATNAVSGPITVSGNNLCGDGSPSPGFNVTVNALPSAAGAITGTASVCAGSDGVAYSVATISGATGYAWTLPIGATIVTGANTNSITIDFAPGASSGSITVFGTSSCGNGTVSPAYAVTVNPVPPAPVVTASGNLLTSTAPSGNQWYWNGSAVAGATQQTLSVPAANSGHYWTIVTLNSCSSDSSNHVYVAGVGVPENESLSFNIYPVPNNGLFTATVNSNYTESFRIEIYNTLGAMVYKSEEFKVIGKHDEKVDVHQLPAGIYSVVFRNDQRKVVKKIFINH